MDAMLLPGGSGPIAGKGGDCEAIAWRLPNREAGGAGGLQKRAVARRSERDYVWRIRARVAVGDSGGDDDLLERAPRRVRAMGVRVGARVAVGDSGGDDDLLERAPRRVPLA